MSPSPSASVAVDYHALPGRILVEHLGNALDGSEAAGADTTDRRRFYLMSPADMTARSAVEFLPGAPPSGKTVADISPDGRRVIFQDMAAQGQIWEADLDGTGLHQVTTPCSCIEGSRLRILPVPRSPSCTSRSAARARIGIRDLASGTVTKLETTAGPGTDPDPPEQPSWSPDGTSWSFIA